MHQIFDKILMLPFLTLTMRQIFDDSVAMEQLDKPGAFEFRVPISVGRVWLSAFNDANTNGRPDPQDPTGFYAKNPVDVSGGGVVDGLTILLEVREPPEHQKGEW